MPATTTEKNEVRDELNRAHPNTIADVLRKMRVGTMLDPMKVTVAGLAAAAAVDITAAATRAAATVNSGQVPTGENLPAVLDVRTLRVTGVGTATAGPRVVTDVDGTAVAPDGGGRAGVALISNDGKTLTFEGTVTGFVIEYIPRSYTDLTADFTPVT